LKKSIHPSCLRRLSRRSGEWRRKSSRRCVKLEKYSDKPKLTICLKLI
jgi:hypothetical protein